MKIKKGDSVIIIAGKNRGKIGTVERVLLKENRLAVAGINEYKKHVRKSVTNPTGGVISIFRPINASNAMFLDTETKKPTRIGWKVDKKTKVRMAKTTGKAI